MERSEAGLLTHISLFAGMGCESIAAEWAGFETILHCEIDPDCQKVLRKYWPDVPIIEDIRNVTRESVITNTNFIRCDRQQVKQGQTQTRRRWFRENHQLTLLSAGCPCQPASGAGKRRGKADVRWLWPEAIRVLDELQPAWGVFENPVGIGSLGEYGEILSMGDEAAQGISDTEAVELDRLCGQIEACGYEVQPVSIPACAVGAPHERQRIFIICHYRNCGLSRESWRRAGEKSQDGCMGNESNPHAHGGRCQQHDQGQRSLSESSEGSSQLGTYPGWQQNWIEVAQRLCSKTQSGVRSMDARSTPGLLGLSRVAKLKMLGNANPPQQYYPIYKAIADIEKSKE
jgi:DNA (cytosine-5)-methyltransferase 1